uniref:Uncharacterized protein n=1 Tax=Triticum urartu TaxID=4572 RepID=A0A8R7QAI5_TRIUA
MGHSNVWNSHPKNYGPGSRVCWRLVSSDSGVLHMAIKIFFA